MPDHAVHDFIQVCDFWSDITYLAEACSLRRLACEYFIQDQTKGIYIGSLIDDTPWCPLFWGSVLKVSETLVGLGFDTGIHCFDQELRDPKIGNHEHIGSRIVQNILGLQISMPNI